MIQSSGIMQSRVERRICLTTVFDVGVIFYFLLDGRPVCAAVVDKEVREHRVCFEFLFQEFFNRFAGFDSLVKRVEDPIVGL